MIRPLTQPMFDDVGRLIFQLCGSVPENPVHERSSPTLDDEMVKKMIGMLFFSSHFGACKVGVDFLNPHDVSNRALKKKTFSFHSILNRESTYHIPADIGSFQETHAKSSCFSQSEVVQRDLVSPFLEQHRQKMVCRITISRQICSVDEPKEMFFKWNENAP